MDRVPDLVATRPLRMTFTLASRAFGEGVGELFTVVQPADTRAAATQVRLTDQGEGHEADTA